MRVQTAKLLSCAAELFRRIPDENRLCDLAVAILACARERSLQVVARGLERLRKLVQTLSERVSASFGGRVECRHLAERTYQARSV